MYCGLVYFIKTCVSPNNSLKFDAGVGLGVISFNNSGFDRFPRFASQFRHYFDFGSRAQKAKNSSGNSGIFVGIYAHYTSDNSLLDSGFDLESANIIKVGPAGFAAFYGASTPRLRRSYASGFNWGWQLGFNVLSVDDTETGSTVTVPAQFSLYPSLKVTFGWVVGKSNSK